MALATALLGHPTAASTRDDVTTRSEVRVEDPTEVALRTAGTFALRQLARTDRALAPGRFPTVAPQGKPWRTSDTSGWLAGFWPGRLWLAYELDGQPSWARRAAARQAPLAVRRTDTTTHDLGFLLQTSFGRGAAQPGRGSDARVVRRAAASLASRYVPAADAIRSWNGPDGQVTVIIDNLMNLELLFAAARTGSRAQWREIARRHAVTSAEQHLRPDGSTFHVVRFDETTGRRVWRGTRQGLADDSTWSRGQAWAVHGFTTAYRETGDARLLEAARRAAGFVVANAPADGVPWWDYDAPGTTRDTTAAAIVASGLLELARIDPDPTRQVAWRAAGMQSLRSLTGPDYLARGTAARSVLLHGHHDPVYSDAGVTYADYYLLEALLRVQLLPSSQPALPALAEQGGERQRVVDLGFARPVSAVSIRWERGEQAPTRFRLQVSPDGVAWRTVRGGVSSGRWAGLETYDVRDTVTRFVRVVALGPRAGAVPEEPAQVLVRG